MKCLLAIAACLLPVFAPLFGQDADVKLEFKMSALNKALAQGSYPKLIMEKQESDKSGKSEEEPVQSFIYDVSAETSENWFQNLLARKTVYSESDLLRIENGEVEPPGSGIKPAYPLKKSIANADAQSFLAHDLVAEYIAAVILDPKRPDEIAEDDWKIITAVASQVKVDGKTLLGLSVDEIGKLLESEPVPEPEDKGLWDKVKQVFNKVVKKARTAWDYIRENPALVLGAGIISPVALPTLIKSFGEVFKQSDFKLQWAKVYLVRSPSFNDAGTASLRARVEVRFKATLRAVGKDLTSFYIGTSDTEADLDVNIDPFVGEDWKVYAKASFPKAELKLHHNAYGIDINYSISVRGMLGDKVNEKLAKKPLYDLTGLVGVPLDDGDTSAVVSSVRVSRRDGKIVVEAWLN